MAFDFRQSRAFRGPVVIDSATFYPGQAREDGQRFVGLGPYGQAIWCSSGAMYQGDFRISGPRGVRLWHHWDSARRDLVSEWERYESADRVASTTSDPDQCARAHILADSTNVCVSEISCNILRDVNGVRVASRWCEGLPDWYDADIVDEYDPKWEGGSFVTVYACEMYGPRTTPPQWIRIAAHQVSHELPCPHCGDGSDHYKGRTEDCELCEGIGYLSGEYDSHVTYWVPDGMMSSDD